MSEQEALTEEQAAKKLAEQKQLNTKMKSSINRLNSCVIGSMLLAFAGLLSGMRTFVFALDVQMTAPTGWELLNVFVLPVAPFCVASVCFAVAAVLNLTEWLELLAQKHSS